jgi:hypothetical protein
MKRYFALAGFVLACRSINQESANVMVPGDSAWSARVRSSVCRRPAYETANWTEFLTAKRSATIRVPPFLRRDRFQAAADSTSPHSQNKAPAYAAAWNDFDSGDQSAQFAVGVDDSVTLAFPGNAEPDESICLETIGGAQATVLAYSRGAARPTPGSLRLKGAAGDSADRLGPYLVNATIRFSDGLGLLIFGTASTLEQQNQMLAAIRTIRRVRNRQ